MPSSNPELPLRRTARKFAIQYLYQVDVSADDSGERSLQRFWEQAEEVSEKYGEREQHKIREHVRRFVNGVVADRESLDDAITRNLRNWEFKRLAVVDRNILRLGAWELLDADEHSPPASIINEAIVLAKAFGSDDSAGFINAVLDAIHKEASSADGGA